MMTVTIFGYYGFANAGDEAILTAIVQQLRSRQSDLRIIVSSGNPAVTAAAHHVEAIPWNQISEIKNAIESSALVIIGGGGLFHDYWGTDPDTMLTDRHWGVSYYAGCAVLAGLYQKPLMFYGVGVGPLESEHSIRLTRAAFECASVITVRDEESKTCLADIGISIDQISVTGDAAFAYRPDTGTQLADVVEHKSRLLHPILAVAVRPWNVGVSAAFFHREMAAALDLFIEQTGGSAVFFPFQEIPGELEDDRATAQRIVENMRSADRAQIVPPLSPEQICGAFQGCDLLFGMRLHSLIFAALFGLPSVALSYDPKINSAVGVLGLRAPMLDVKSIDARTVAETLLTEYRSPANSSVDTARVAALKVLSAEPAARAFQLLDSPPSISAVGEPFADMLRRSLVVLSRTTAKAKADAAAIEGLSAENAGLKSRIWELSEQAVVLNSANIHQTNKFNLLNNNFNAFQRDCAVAASTYRGKLADDLALYRSQRAWKIMVFIRKAYALLSRGSKVAFLKWTLGFPLLRAGSMKEHEPEFPDIKSYLPDALARMIDEPAFARERPRRAKPSGSDPASIPREKYDVLVLAIIDFDFRFQRPQQIAVEFARQGHRVLWVSPSRFLLPSSKCAFEDSAIRENIHEIHLRGPQPDIYKGELRSEHLDAMSQAIGELYDQWNLADTVIIAQLPFWRRLGLRVSKQYGGKLLYDCMDDWDTFQNLGSFNITEEALLVRECDILIVTGAGLEQKFRAMDLNPVLVRNGADYDFFSNVAPVNLLPTTPRPIVGYFGAIADWIDLALVYEVAKSRPDYSFVLIGQVFDRDVAALESLPNVRLLGHKKYEDIPGYLFSFDVCIIPFLLNPVTAATDPVKLYEYFSLGKPVVATAMAELGQVEDLLYIGQDPADFAEKLDAAVSETGDDLRRRRIDFAKANTWSSRVTQMDAAVRSAYQKVSIIVVTYNSEEFVKPCVDSVLRNTGYPSYELILIDNGSADSTPEMLRAYAGASEFVTAITMTENLGFAAANNRAAHEASGEFLIFLNADTIVPPGWLYRLLEHFRQDSSIGLLCPVTNFAGNEVRVIVDYDDPETMEDFALALARQNRGRTLDVGVVPLFCGVTTRAVWNAAGGLDETFGIGMFEDDDFSEKVRDLGLRVVAAEDCFVHHFGQGSFAKLPADAYSRLFDKNRQRFEEKWRKPWTAHCLRPGVPPLTDKDRFHPSRFGPGRS